MKAALLFVLAVLACGCGSQDSAASNLKEVEEIKVTGFDPDGEPVIEKWSDGSLRIRFEAMPPFFAEDNGTEAEFENFETKMQDALGVPVTREDREVFLIPNPKPDTVQKAEAWLKAYPKKDRK